MQLAFPAAKSFGLWELTDLNEAESAAEAEEGCRLTYVAASRAEDRLILSGAYKPADLEPVEEPKPGDSALRRLLPALAAASGWEGGDGDRRPARAAADRLGRAARGRARSRSGSPSRAPSGPRSWSAASTRRPSPSRWPGVVAPPPLVAAPAPRRCRSATSPTRRSPSYERCGYRFYVERVLGAREPRRAAGDRRGATRRPRGADELIEPERRRAAWRSGSATPSTRRSSGAPGAAGSAADDELLGGCSPARALDRRRGGAARAGALVAGWLDSRSARRARRRRRSGPSCRSCSGSAATVIRGQIDLLAEPAGGMPTVVDYKTDALDGRAPAELAERYRAQREVYALAAGRPGTASGSPTSSSRRPTSR